MKIIFIIITTILPIYIKAQTFTKNEISSLYFANSFSKVDSILSQKNYTFDGTGKDEKGDYVFYRDKTIPAVINGVYVIKRQYSITSIFDVIVVSSNKTFFNEKKNELTNDKDVKILGEKVEGDKLLMFYCNGLEQTIFIIDNDKTSGVLYSVYFKFATLECLPK